MLVYAFSRSSCVTDRLKECGASGGNTFRHFPKRLHDISVQSEAAIGVREVCSCLRDSPQEKHVTTTHRKRLEAFTLGANGSPVNLPDSTLAYNSNSSSRLQFRDVLAFDYFLNL